MPRPPADGCYAIKRPSGAAFIAQWSGGRLVDLTATTTTNPPKRTTTRYLGPSLTEVLEERRREREARIYQEIEREMRTRAVRRSD